MVATEVTPVSPPALAGSSSSGGSSSPSRAHQQHHGPPLSPSSGRGTLSFHRANNERSRSRRPATASSILQAAVASSSSNNNGSSATMGEPSRHVGHHVQRSRASSISVQTLPPTLAYTLAEPGPSSAPPASPTFSHRPKPEPRANTFNVDMSGVRHHSDGEEVAPKKQRRNSLLSLELFTSKSASSDDEEVDEGFGPIPRSPSSIISISMEDSRSASVERRRDDWKNSARRWSSSLGRSGSQYLQSASPYLRAGLNELYDIFNMEGETGTVEPSLLPTAEFPRGGSAASSLARQARRRGSQHVSSGEGSVATTCSSSMRSARRKRQMSGDTAATTPEDGGSSSCSESALGERPFLQQHSASATLPTSKSENSQSSLLDERGRALLRRSHSARASATPDLQCHSSQSDTSMHGGVESSLSRRDSEQRRSGRVSGTSMAGQHGSTHTDRQADIKRAVSLDVEPPSAHEGDSCGKNKDSNTKSLPLQASERRAGRCPSPRRVAVALLTSASMLSAFCIFEVTLRESLPR
jgi:hypothetical protein